MKTMSNLLYVSLIGLFIFNFFFRNQAEADPIKSYESYQAGKAIFIDVREESEVKEGMIKGAIWIPLSRIEANPKKEIENLNKRTLNKELFVYCRSGSRSARVQSLLKEAGISSINLGGFSGLVKNSLPTQTGPQ